MYEGFNTNPPILVIPAKQGCKAQKFVFDVVKHFIAFALALIKTDLQFLSKQVSGAVPTSRVRTPSADKFLFLN